MIITPEIYRKPSILNTNQFAKLSQYIQNKIRFHIKTCNVFTCRDFFGYENWNWSGTPAQAIYNNYLKYYDGDEKLAYRQSAVTLGHYMKIIVNSMPEKFKIQRLKDNWNRIEYCYIRPKK